MIYIDPPYNTGNDFVYEDDFAQSTDDYIESSGQTDDEGNRLVANTESNGRFHTDWLNMMYPRMKIARDFLSDDGAIFISIDDNEVENLKKICDEIFGNGAFVCQFVWQKRKGGGNDSVKVAIDHEYILVYSKDTQNIRWRIPYEESYLTRYKYKDEKGRYYYDTLSRSGLQSPIIYDVVCPDGTVIKNGKWQISKKTFEEGLKSGEVAFLPQSNGGYSVVHKVRVPEGRVKRSIIADVTNKNAADEMDELFGNKKIFSNPKPVSLIDQLIDLLPESANMTVMDFFSGSATTAHSVIKHNVEKGTNYKFIVVQLPEKLDENNQDIDKGYKTICDIAKDRIRKAGKIIIEKQKKCLSTSSKTAISNWDIGFRVLKLDSSNMIDVYYKPSDVINDIFSQTENNIKEDRTDEDLLFQVMLEISVPLSAKISSEKICGKKVLIVDDDYLIACFDKNITDEVVTDIAKRKPQYFVMRDSSASDDSVITNFETIFQTYSKDTVRKIL